MQKERYICAFARRRYRDTTLRESTSDRYMDRLNVYSNSGT